MSYFCEQCTQAERDTVNVLYIHEHCLLSLTAYSYHSSNGQIFFSEYYKVVNVYLLYLRKLLCARFSNKIITMSDSKLARLISP